MDWEHPAKLSKWERSLRNMCSKSPFVRTAVGREHELRRAVVVKDRALSLSLLTQKQKKGLTIRPSKRPPGVTDRAKLGTVQSSAPFFTKLPCEIRTAILEPLIVCPWGHILIRMWNGQLTWQTLYTRDLDSWRDWRKKQTQRPPSKSTIMAILRTCHQMCVQYPAWCRFSLLRRANGYRYAEAIDLVHRQNVVELDQVHVLPFLFRSLADRHIHSIRRLKVSPFEHSLDSLPPTQSGTASASRVVANAKSCWRVTCELLCSMTNLRELTVDLPMHSATDWTVAELLGPLEAIKTSGLIIHIQDMQYERLCVLPDFNHSSFNSSDSAIRIFTIFDCLNGCLPPGVGSHRIG